MWVWLDLCTFWRASRRIRTTIDSAGLLASDRKTTSRRAPLPPLRRSADYSSSNEEKEIERERRDERWRRRESARRKEREEWKKADLDKKNEKCKREDVDVKPRKYANFLVKVKEEPYICNPFG